MRSAHRERDLGLEVAEVGQGHIAPDQPGGFQHGSEDQVVVGAAQRHQVRRVPVEEGESPLQDDVHVRETEIHLAPREPVRPPLAVPDVEHRREPVAILRGEAAGLQADVADRLRVEHRDESVEAIGVQNLETIDEDQVLVRARAPDDELRGEIGNAGDPGEGLQ